MNIFEQLREDHQKQRTLVDLLAKTHGDSEGRNELFSRLKQALQNHADAEERHFYTPLFENDLTQGKARHSVAEHHEMDELIEQLEETEFSSPAWLGIAKQLKERVIHHLDEEEQEVFQLAGKALSDKKKTALGQKYREMMNELEGK
jgi:hemerythrin-like domain-containing protein